MAKKEIAIVGVGRFGSSVIEKIKDIPHLDIIAIDSNEEHLKKEDNLSKYYIGNAAEDNFLNSLGLDSVDVFVVGIGDNIQASLLIASIIKSQ
jgi:trk system potassium uptake protein TrkA